MIRKVVVIMGPTAAGKSALALKLAKVYQGEIINADSRQVYVGMDIGTDKVTPQRHPEPQRRISFTGRDSSASPQNDRLRARHEPLLVEGIPHYLIDILAPDQRYSAAEFREDATRGIGQITARGKLPIVVGGTGFYLRVLTGHQKLLNVPPHPALRAWAGWQPLEALVTELRERSPELYAKVDDLQNRRRVTRYLEIARARGNREQGATPHSPLLNPKSMLKLALTPPADVLRSRIEARVDRMLRQGLLAEVHSLVKRYGVSAPGLQTPGYRQVLTFIAEQTSLVETRTAIVRAHRETARRQLVWLKKEPGITVAEDVASAERLVDQFLSAQ